MKAKFSKIDKDSEFPNNGYNKYVQNVELAHVDKTDFDGLVSLCIDARLPVTKIYSHFQSKEPVSTAGNAIKDAIKSLKNFSDNNALVSHGVHPLNNPSHHPACGGHNVAFKTNPVYSSLISSLKPYVKNTFDDYDPFLTIRNLSVPWHSSDSRFYDHTTGILYDLDNNKVDLGVNPTTQHEGLNPAVGQDPHLIIINTLGKPFYSISSGQRAREIGGFVEIFYPETKLPENILESLVYCLENHYINKNIAESDDNANFVGNFRNSDTLLLLADSENGVKEITNSILSTKNKHQREFIEGYFKDPKDIVLGVVPELDTTIVQITAK